MSEHLRQMASDPAPPPPATDSSALMDVVNGAWNNATSLSPSPSIS
ncbi:hypothetical protein ABK905_11755 [Acerihabitans sp. KWT182]|uniref:Uncharacterized protein n=1 Tax=Acerihabitans sp. KWT182 TaxID=3157919 RepID=A0AAU7QF86_9GAMM